MSSWFINEEATDSQEWTVLFLNRQTFLYSFTAQNESFLYNSSEAFPSKYFYIVPLWDNKSVINVLVRWHLFVHIYYKDGSLFSTEPPLEKPHLTCKWMCLLFS